MKKILVVGSQGSIGRRWSAIFKKKFDYEVFEEDIKGVTFDHKQIGTRLAIVATPTVNHLDCVRELLDIGYRVLCEKPFLPIDQNASDFYDFLECGQLQIVNNWKYVIPMIELELNKHEITYRNLVAGSEDFKSNMFQPIAFSSSLEVELDYPGWECYIDDMYIPRDFFDISYVRLADKWLNDDLGGWGIDYFEALSKVRSYKI